MKKQNDKGLILDKPANDANDVTTAQGGDMVTREVNPNTEPAAPEKTPAELADERKKTARDEAKKATVEKYSGKPADLLTARSIAESTNGKQRAIDFTYSWTDENGATCTATGKLNVTAVMTADAGKTWRDCADRVQGFVVAYHGADGDKKTAIRKQAGTDIASMFALCGAPREAKKNEIADILDSAYLANANGDDDSTTGGAVAWTVQAVARRLLQGRAKQNADKARKDAKAKQDADKAAKAESKAA